MKDLQILEAALFSILEEKNSDLVKSAKISSLLESIKIINDTYQQQIKNLKTNNILSCNENPLISIDTEKTRQSPLLLAVSNGDAHCTKLLIQAGADIEFTSGTYMTPLMTAAENGHAACVDLLIKAKAKLNVKTNSCNFDKSALMFAATSGSAACVQLLLEARANPNLREKHYPKDDAFLLAVKEGHTECVKLLMDKVDINQKNEAREHALEMAIKNGDHKLLEILAFSPKINLELPPAWGDRPILLAIYADNQTAVKILLDAKVDIHFQTEDHTLLTYAASRHSENIVKFLCKAGLDVNGKTQCGETALMKAAEWGGDASMVSLLCKLGAIVTGDELNSLMSYSLKVESIKTIVTLLQWGSIIKNPNKFIKYLQIPVDYSKNPDIIYCFEVLHEQLKKHPLIDYENKKWFDLKDNTMLEVKVFQDFLKNMAALDKATPYWQLETTHQLMQCSAFKKVPRDVMDMISLWDCSVGRTALSNLNTDKKVETYMKKLEEKIKSDPLAKKHIHFFISQSNKRKVPCDEVVKEKKLNS